MLFGIQLASLAVLVSVLISYFRNKRMPLLSTRLFTTFLCAVCGAIALEITAYGSLSLVQTNTLALSPIVYGLCNRVYIVAMETAIFLLYIYVDVRTHVQRYAKALLVLQALPLAAGAVIAAVAPLDYHWHTMPHAYGLPVDIAYVVVVLYMVLALFRLLRSGNSLSKHARHSLFIGLGVWFAAAVAQLIQPHFVFTSLALVLMVQFVYVSYENPRDFVEPRLPQVMNTTAMRLALNDQFARRRDFYLVSLTLFFDASQRHADYRHEPADTMKQAAQHLQSLTGGPVFHVADNTLTVLVTDQALVDRILHGPMPELRHNAINDVDIPVQCSPHAVACPHYAATVDDALSVLRFTAAEVHRASTQGAVLVDDQFVQQMNYRATVRHLVADAVHGDGLEMVYQPIYNTQQKRFTAAEALVRLKDTTTLGYVSPEVFIPIAEEYGLISSLGIQVMDQVCRFARDNELWNLGIDYIEINISGIQTMDPRLPVRIRAVLDKYGVHPAFLNFELTETASVMALEDMERTLSALRQMCCHFSMDDFGTGYSNIAKMTETSFELIKLDKSLIWPCFGPSPEKPTMVLQSVVSMIHNLGAGIVAEGVETKEQAELMEQFGVEYLQGFYFARPMHEQDFLQSLRAQK